MPVGLEVTTAPLARLRQFDVADALGPLHGPLDGDNWTSPKTVEACTMQE